MIHDIPIDVNFSNSAYSSCMGVACAQILCRMTQESQTIEVEVVTIDGTAPVVRDPERTPTGLPWQNWRGRTLKFDNYWWPLWVIPGVVVLLLLMLVGVFFGAIYVVFRAIRGMLRALIR